MGLCVVIYSTEGKNTTTAVPLAVIHTGELRAFKRPMLCCMRGRGRCCGQGLCGRLGSWRSMGWLC